MIILVDWDDDKILLKDIDLPGPSFHSIMPKYKINKPTRFYINCYLLITGSFRASMGLGFEVKRENQNVVNMCTLGKSNELYLESFILFAILTCSCQPHSELCTEDTSSRN